MGVTLSAEQLAESRARAKAEGLADRVRFELLDYRAVSERFDRIVSVGMFEHVGVVHYRQFFATLARCLKPDGVALLHAIGRNDKPGSTNPWMNKYIFPGGYCPALSEVFPPIEQSGLLTTDMEICGCTTPRPCAIGAGASPPTAMPSPRCTMSGSAACSSSTSPGPSCRSGVRT